MPQMQYNPDELRTGSGQAQASSDAAGNAQTTLQSAAAGASPYGDVNGAAALHGAVTVAHQHHTANAQRTSQNMHAAAQRATGTAALGDDNTTETTALAPRSTHSNAIKNGM